MGFTRVHAGEDVNRTPCCSAGRELYQYGHYGAALLGYAPVGFLLAVTGFEDRAILGAVGAAALAMVPDVDLRVPLVTHRGVTHTVWFAAATGVVLGIFGVLVGLENGVLSAVGFGVFGMYLGAVSVCSHIAADALTPAGVEPFAPVRDTWYGYDVAKARNPVANAALLMLGGVVAGACFVAGAGINDLLF